MIKVPVILASVIAVVPCHAQDVRVFSGSQEHVYGSGGQLLDSPELRAKNERSRQMPAKRSVIPVDQQGLSIQRNNPSRVPNSWWSNDAARLQPPKSWWNNNGYKPPESAWSQ